MSKTFNQGKDEIAKLCRYFAANRQAFLAPGVKEAHVRQSLIDPFFEALGWDVRNAAMVAPQYREVVPEDSLEIEGQQKAPDYTFRVGAQPRFYVEAKKCGVNISSDPGPAFQLRRYGWSAKVVLSILTDFEELGDYDCTLRPRIGDKASYARIHYFRAEEYPDRWRELWDVFSREAVWSGLFDQYAVSKRKRGTSEVDAEFLKEIEGWRDALARNIALRNSDISLDDLNAAVQVTIDRIVFLRMAEDRGIEPYQQLSRLCEQPDIYARFMREACRKADEKYNSGLFHFQKEAGVLESPDKVTPDLAIDDKVIKPILQGLYFENGSPYHFGVMPVEILGTVYERFLGKVIRLTDGHQAKIEEKPEVRKAGGVYYTPSYIVDYIVKNTVGKLIHGRSPAELGGGKGKPPFRVLDMACGSGSFLLGAYQHLLDHSLSWYRDNKPESHKKAVSPDTKSGDWRLTIDEKKRLLTTHIYGVDIDPQAVEVSKLSLLLKVLEGETDRSFGEQMKIFQERALPSLANNIKCGNSLIGPDYFADKLMPDPEELRRINPFDWTRAFPDAMKAGGFDCVIGNPPYVRIQTMKEWAPKEVEIYKELFLAARVGNYDIYVVFIEQGLKLLSAHGLLGFICPHKFFNAKYGEALRSIIAKGQHLAYVVHFGDQQVFDGATTYTCLLFLNKSSVKECRFIKVDDLSAWRTSDIAAEGVAKAANITADDWNFAVGKGAALFERLGKIPLKLGEVADIFQGIVTSADGIYIVPTNLKIEQEIAKPYFSTGDLLPYSPAITTGRIIVPYDVKAEHPELISIARFEREYPKAWSYLNMHRPALAGREKGKMNNSRWYGYVYPKNLVKFAGEKLIIQVTAKRPTVIYDVGGLYMTGGGSGPFYGIRLKNHDFSIKFLLSILNSTLFGWIIHQQSTNLRGGYIKFSKQYIEKAPMMIPLMGQTPNQKQFTRLVDSMLDLNRIC